MQGRRLVPVMIALVGMLVAGATAEWAEAQSAGEPSGYQIQTTDANDLQTQVSLGWGAFWSGRFGSLSVFGWGRTSTRSGSIRASVAVLRERHGLLR